MPFLVNAFADVIVLRFATAAPLTKTSVNPGDRLSTLVIKGGMNSADVINLYTALERLGVEIWIDGGWGVDVLLGEQTRPHNDLDIAIEQKDVPILRQFLQTQKFRDIKLEEARAWNLVLGDENGREIDVHVIVLDDKGNGLYGPPEKGEVYPAASLTGIGKIEGQTVRCISPEWTVKFHSGYQLKEKDFRDVSALCEKIGIDLPAAYEQFTKQE
ncbi:MAG TPA: aminoglycoside nucleotidyltransferase [Candidatus Dormibacteraeota bacterium]|nr:aminoglycoside nucleotidyltransferase [Candidatus Dormibacteraeota bacterium]